MAMVQEVSLPTLAAIHSNPQAGRQIKEASLSFLFNGGGAYRVPNRAWRTAIWFATGQKLATQEEAFYEDWNGQEWGTLVDNTGEHFELHVQGTETGRFKNES